MYKTNQNPLSLIVQRSFYLLFVLYSLIICDGGLKVSQAKTIYQSHHSIHIGVIDQIDLPWIVVMSESGETFYVLLSNSQISFKEGQWVIYVSSSNYSKKSIYPLNLNGIRQFKHMMSHSLKEQLNRLKQGRNQSSSFVF